MYSELYTEFKRRCPDLLHFAAHSHHPWPDVTQKAHSGYWDFSVSQLDRKWRQIFSELIPDVQQLLAEELGVTNPTSFCFAPNTHELVARILSSLIERKEFAILTTDGEFHSARRQIDRYAELEGASVQKIAVAPYETFSERFIEAARSGCNGKPFDLIFSSHVFFLSGFQIPNLSDFVEQLKGSAESIVIDGYHAFGAIPLDLQRIQESAFYVAGGYKYAQSGEGACFLHVPESTTLRPLNTGWFAEFEGLEHATNGGKVPFGKGAERFWGATFDPSGLFRMRAVLSLFKEQNITARNRHEYVRKLQRYFLEQLSSRGSSTVLQQDSLLVDDIEHGGHFLAFRCKEAEHIQQSWEKKNVQVDVRGDILRVGFGIYQTRKDIDAFFERISSRD